MKYLENVNKAKRGTTIKNKKMAESTTKKRFDKMYKASKPGERKSKKFAKITMADGSTFRRRNANDSYPDGVPGGKKYTENRKNRTDKRVYLEEGGSVSSAPMGEYETTLQSNIEMGEGIEMAKRGKSIASRKKLAGAIKKDLQAEYRADLNKQLDANLKATHAGYRKSKKYAKIMKRDGTYFRRRNANDSYPDGVPGGSVYYEARPNRTDKRVFLEDGGNLPFETGFVYNIGGL